LRHLNCLPEPSSAALGVLGDWMFLTMNEAGELTGDGFVATPVATEVTV
jgi:hypothetical protein